ncbi:MAG: hypothetical protein ABIQ86_13350 [Steroidobacteraceae bacterium]
MTASNDQAIVHPPRLWNPDAAANWFKYLMVASVISLISCAAVRATEDAPILRAMFDDIDRYSSETGLLTRIMCGGDTVSVSAPIAPNIVKDIARSALPSDLFSIDTRPKPVFSRDGKLLTLIDSGCWESWFEISVGDKVHLIGWNCHSLQVGEREEIRRLKRALEPFLKKLPEWNCARI